jgi:hypothetical protein
VPRSGPEIEITRRIEASAAYDTSGKRALQGAHPPDVVPCVLAGPALR